MTSATRFSARAGAASANSAAARLKANAALNDSKIFIFVPRLFPALLVPGALRFIHIAGEPHYAIVDQPAPPVQPSEAARPLHFRISGTAKFRASAHSASSESMKLSAIASSDETISTTADI